MIAQFVIISFIPALILYLNYHVVLAKTSSMVNVFVNGSGSHRKVNVHFARTIFGRDRIKNTYKLIIIN